MTLINAVQLRIKSSIVSLNMAWFILLGLPGNMGSLSPYERMQANGQLKVLLQLPESRSNLVGGDQFMSDIDPSSVTLELLQAFAENHQVRLDLTVQTDKITQTDYNDYDLIALSDQLHQTSSVNSITDSYPVEGKAIAHKSIERKPIESDPAEKLLRTTPYLNLDAYVVYRKGSRSQLSSTPTPIEIAEPESLFKTFKSIENRKLASTVVLSYQWAPYKAFMPKLVGRNIGHAVSLTWGFPRQSDQRLYDSAQTFLQDARDSGYLTRLQNHYVMLPDQKPLISAPVFTEHVAGRLNTYTHVFKRAAAKYQLDWQLLAAISYQESRWLPDAVSPTGVQGLMMLTQDTANEMGISNRQNPIQSIYGAARYLHTIKGRLPDYITEPDRTWMALAAYNIGPAHLLKAIRATEAAGNNSANWLEVRQQLRHASVPKYTSKQKFLRGYDQVRSYVMHVRAYYDYLTRPNLLVAHQSAPTTKRSRILPNVDQTLMLAASQ